MESLKNVSAQVSLEKNFMYPIQGIVDKRIRTISFYIKSEQWPEMDHLWAVNGQGTQEDCLKVMKSD